MFVRRKDHRSTRASLEMTGPAATAVLDAVADAAEALGKVMSAPADSPADPRDALAALVALRRGQAAVDLRVGEMLAWLEVGGVTRGTMSTALGIRPATLASLLAPHDGIASARRDDLKRDDTTGRWTARRTANLPDDDAEGAA